MLNKFWVKTSITIKMITIFIGLLSIGLGIAIGAKSAMAASLKPVSIINADVITLGDLFDGVERNADYVIGSAPQPGKDMTLNARTLYRIAVALDMPWRPASSNDQIIIRREASVVSYNEIENSLRDALKEKGLEGNFNLALNNGKPTMVLPNDVPSHVEVSNVNFDHQKDYFQATLAAPSAENPIKKMSVSGMVERMVAVPVLRNNLQNGDIIGANDIQIINVPEKSLQHDVITNEDDLIGMTPRRIAYSGKYILEGNLQKPQLVERGEKVTITFKEGPLVLTAKGKALQSGAKGDLVRVTNINSSRTVDALVIGNNEVTAR